MIKIKKKSCFIITLVLSIVLFCSGAVYGLTSASVTNNLETGFVGIRLEEFQKVDLNLVPWTDKEAILPGEKISKITRIHNAGSGCYVRAKFTLPETVNVQISGIDGKWKKFNDGYWYYTEVLSEGGSLDFSHSIFVSKNIPENLQGTTFDIETKIEAIQSKNFEPQFDNAAPWGNVEILKNENNISMLKQADSQSFEIEYQGSSASLITNKNDFFSNIPYLMPGDKHSESVKIKNTSDKKVKLYFRSEVIDNSELLDQIQLKITTDISGKEKVVYEGNLKAESIRTDVLLGTIERGASADMFKFEISVPLELNNTYSQLHSMVKWVFSTETKEGGGGIITEPDPTPEPEPKPDDPGKPDPKPDKPSKEDKPQKNPGSQESIPKTGDEMNLPLYFCFMLGSLALGIFSVYGLRRNKEEDV